VKPLIDVSFIRDNSGKDLTFHKQMFRLKCTKSHYTRERYMNHKLESLNGFKSVSMNTLFPFALDTIIYKTKLLGNMIIIQFQE
jgi:hypothetical protein